MAILMQTEMEVPLPGISPQQFVLTELTTNIRNMEIQSNSRDCENGKLLYLSAISQQQAWTFYIQKPFDDPEIKKGLEKWVTRHCQCAQNHLRYGLLSESEKHRCFTMIENYVAFLEWLAKQP